MFSQVYHKSVKDWLVDEARFKAKEERPFYVEVASGHKRLGQAAIAALTGTQCAAACDTLRPSTSRVVT